MSTTVLLEVFGGFLAACMALWFVALSRPADQPVAAQMFSGGQGIFVNQFETIRSALEAYVLKQGGLSSLGLLLLRLAIGVMMIHHGHEKLADPQQFANTYVASLHLPFPLFFAYAAGFSELIGSWLVILGFFTPFGALALTGTMTVAAYQHILTAGLNIYVLELVVLYLGGSLAILLVGPGRFSFDAGMLPGLLAKSSARTKPDTSAPLSEGISGLVPAYVPINVGNSDR